MEETLRQHLFETARIFEASAGVSLASIGKRSLNDNTFFSRLGADQGFTVKTYDRVMGWMRANWPDGVEMPALPLVEGAAA